jgi:hypothetical protein
VTLGIYSVAADISVYSGVDSASKNEYQDIPGGKGGRCVRVTTLPPSCAECLVIWSLNRPEPSMPHRPVIGVALEFRILVYYIQNLSLEKTYIACSTEILQTAIQGTYINCNAKETYIDVSTETHFYVFNQ